MSSHSDSSLLNAGAAAINRWRVENPKSKITSRNTKLQALDLSGANLAGADLLGTQFIDCDLRHVNFEGASLVDARFIRCSLAITSFHCTDLSHAAFHDVSIDGANFKQAEGLSRLRAFRPVLFPTTSPLYDRAGVPWVDRMASWDRLRLLGKVRIFVPAYASLGLTVLALNIIGWVNIGIEKINNIFASASLGAMAPFQSIEPSWTQLAVLINFALLAIAATTFLACPARITEFSRERWVSELQRSELLYDISTWERPLARIVCSLSLATGGVTTLILLTIAISKQAIFIISHSI